MMSATASLVSRASATASNGCLFMRASSMADSEVRRGRLPAWVVMMRGWRSANAAIALFLGCRFLLVDPWRFTANASSGLDRGLAFPIETAQLNRLTHQYRRE